MLLPIEVWFPAFKAALVFGVVAIVVDSLLQPRRLKRPSPPPAAEKAVDVDKAA